MAKKTNSKVVESTENYPNVHLYLPNLIGYVRFVAIVASWKFALSDPIIFTALYATSYLLGAIDGTVARLLKQCSFFGA